MKNLEYDDGTPSRTWVADDYDPKKIDVDFYLAGLLLLIRDDVTVEKARTYIEPIRNYIIELEQKLGLNDE